MATNSLTDEILSAHDYAAEFIRSHALNLSSMEIRPGSPTAYHYNRETKEWDLPVLPTIRVSAHKDWDARDSREFVAWCRAIGADTVHVTRRDDDTCLHAHARRDGHSWHVYGDVSRPRDGSPHLPGITVDWIRQESGRRGNTAHVTVDDLEIALTNLVRVPQQVNA